MSGITGIFNVGGSSVDKGILERMTKAIAHRGSDGEGFLLSSNVGLGHRRRAVIDLTEAGHQPMTTEDGVLTIVHDGQVHNAPEIRQELENKGYHFRSNTDTETILYSYGEWGEECLERFNGIWSFAIWNSESKSLFGSRDRIGAKPFYYYFDGEILVFASEIKALFEHPGVPRRVNEGAVYNYVTWGLSGDAEDTFFAGIKELSPSHCLRVNSREGLKIRQWWKVKINLDSNDLSSDDQNQAARRLSWLLEDAVRIRLRSDVPIGTSLSGGLDSSAVTALAAKLILDEHGIKRQLVGEKLKTFSSCYENESMDERWFIEKVLEKTGAEGNFDFPDAGRIWNELPKIIRQQDGPSGVFSVYARWSLAQRAKARGVKVLLDGDGSDVLLAGHHRYYGVFFLELAIKGRILRLLSEVRSAAAIGGIRDLFSYANTTLGGGILGHVPVSFQMGMRHLIFRVRGRSTDKALAPAFDKAYEKYGLSCISQHYRRNNASLNQHLGSDLAEFGNSIKYSDSLYTPFGIETRAPFLDHRLIEYVFSLPASLKIRDGWTKWLLRQSMQGILPEEIRLRKDKIGYGVPLETWLKTNRKQIKALFSGNVLSRQYINLAFIKDHLDDLLSSKKTCWEVWRYVNLEIWLREFFGDR